MRTLLTLLLVLFAVPAFAQSREDLLQLENYELRMLLLQKEFKEAKDARDALKTKVDAEVQAKAKAEKKDEPTKAK